MSVEIDKISTRRHTIIGVDIDGVLRDYVKGYNEEFVKCFPQYKTVVCEAEHWDWFKDYPWKEIRDLTITDIEYTPEEYALKWSFDSQHTTSMLQNAPCYNDVMMSFNKLLVPYCKSKGLELKLITKQPSYRARKATIEWLLKHSIDFPQIVFVNEWKEKWECCDLLVDDSPLVLDIKPEDKISVKVSHRYNTETEADFTVKSFAEAVDVIIRCSDTFK